MNKLASSAATVAIAILAASGLSACSSESGGDLCAIAEDVADSMQATVDAAWAEPTGDLTTPEGALIAVHGYASGLKDASEDAVAALGKLEKAVAPEYQEDVAELVALAEEHFVGISEALLEAETIEEAFVAFADVESPEYSAGIDRIDAIGATIDRYLIAECGAPVFLTDGGGTDSVNATAAKRDVSDIGVEIAIYYIDHSGPIDVQLVDGYYELNGEPLFEQSPGVVFLSGSSTDATDWCVAVHPEGQPEMIYRYSSVGGLEDGAC